MISVISEYFLFLLILGIRQFAKRWESEKEPYGGGMVFMMHTIIEHDTVPLPLPVAANFIWQFQAEVGMDTVGCSCINLSKSVFLSCLHTIG